MLKIKYFDSLEALPSVREAVLAEHMGEYIDIDKPLRALRPVPVYILTVGSRREGKVNLMALSWVTPIQKHPPLLCAVVEKKNCTHNLLAQYKAYSLSLVSLEHGEVELAKFVGTHSCREVDKSRLKNISIFYDNKDGIEVPVALTRIGYLVLVVERVIDLGVSSCFVSRILKAKINKKYYKNNYLDVGEAQVALHVAKHMFTRPSKDYKLVVETPWGLAVRKYWRDKVGEFRGS